MSKSVFRNLDIFFDIWYTTSKMNSIKHQKRCHGKKVNRAKTRTELISYLTRNRTQSEIHLYFVIENPLLSCNIIVITNYWYCISYYNTFLPALLLCKFIRLRESPESDSWASRNFRANPIPKPRSTLHPPHFHAVAAGPSSKALG